jgi:hypothetical protein
MSKVWFFNFTYSATKEEREGHTSLVTEKEETSMIYSHKVHHLYQGLKLLTRNITIIVVVVFSLDLIFTR